MKYFLILAFLLNFHFASAQGTCGFKDDRGYFYAYTEGGISLLEVMPVDTFFPSLNYLAYIDRYGNFKLFYKHKTYTIFPSPPFSIDVSNYLMAYTLGTQLGVFNLKQSKKVERFTVGGYKLGDSIIGYINNFSILSAYVYDTVVELNNWNDDINYSVGRNIMAWTSQDNKLFAFYNNEIQVVEDNAPEKFVLAQDLIVYNDYFENFKAFDKGEVKTIEQYKIDDFEVCNSMVTYMNNFGEWQLYYNGNSRRLMSTKPKLKFIKRNVIAYADNSGLFSVIYNGKTIPLENYIPTKMDAWDDLLVYQDNYGVLWGVDKGVKSKLSKGIVREWEMQNECVVYYDLTPSIKSVWNKGKIYTYDQSIDPGQDGN